VPTAFCGWEGEPCLYHGAGGSVPVTTTLPLRATHTPCLPHGWQSMAHTHLQQLVLCPALPFCHTEGLDLLPSTLPGVLQTTST